MNQIHVFDPAILLGDRLELTLFGMFVEAYLRGDWHREAELYKRFLQPFVKEHHIHSPEDFCKLIDSVVANGFDPTNPVFANPDEFTLLDGAHRSSIAIQLGVKNLPYALRFRDDRVSIRKFDEVLGSDVLAELLKKRDDYISRCDPLTALKCRLRIHVRKYPDSFQAPFSSETKLSVVRTYQAYEPLRISGKRPSQSRLQIYELDRAVTPSSTVLEVGCNVGFFSLSLSPLVKQVDGFDLDENYITLAKMVQQHQCIDNCQFFVASVGEFLPAQQYDVVISTAVHGWSRIPFHSYLSLITGWLRPGGIILFESHELYAEPYWREKKAFLLAHYDVVSGGLIDDVDQSMYESEPREFLVLRKRPDIDYRSIRLVLPQPVQARKVTHTWIRAVRAASRDVAAALGGLGRALARLGRAGVGPPVKGVRARFRRLRGSRGSKRDSNGTV